MLTAHARPPGLLNRGIVFSLSLNTEPAMNVCKPDDTFAASIDDEHIWLVKQA